MEKDINFIKTDKEGIYLQDIQKNYPNSIINVNSKSEKNVGSTVYQVITKTLEDLEHGKIK